MIQDLVPFEGNITPCASCQRQPKAWRTRTGIFHMECSPCLVKTLKYSTLQEAVQAWEEKNAPATE